MHPDHQPVEEKKKTRKKTIYGAYEVTEGGNLLAYAGPFLSPREAVEKLSEDGTPVGVYAIVNNLKTVTITARTGNKVKVE